MREGTRDPHSQREAWSWLQRNAAVRNITVHVGRREIALCRGELAYSLRFLAKRWQWSIARVQRFLQRRCDEGFITCETVNGITKVTLTKPVTEYATPVTESANDTHPESLINGVSHSNETEFIDQNRDSDTPNESASDTNKGRITFSSQDSVVGDGKTRAREAMISPEAFALADDVMRILGIDVEFVPPGWCGAPMWLQAGLNSGWRPEIVRVAVAKVRARPRFQPPYSFRYLAKPITREHEIWAEPALPVSPVIVSNQDHSHAKAAASTDWRASRDAFRAAHAKLGAFVDQQGAESSSGDSPQVVPFVAPTGRARR